jgi:CRISPR/Cas system type I-B associated protein Csh2 (Cas7 group RAMP superfamily)
MQTVLDVSDKPLKERRNVLDQINQELFVMKDRIDDDGIVSEYFVANIMLKDVDRLMELFAKDQSALMRAFTAVRRSLGQNNTDSYLDPFTGEPYVVEKEQGFFQISTTMLPHPFRVPVFTNSE